MVVLLSGLAPFNFRAKAGSTGQKPCRDLDESRAATWHRPRYHPIAEPPQTFST